MRVIGVVTTGRADFGILRPILHAIRASPELTLELYATGMHLAPQFGVPEALFTEHTSDPSEQFRVDERVAMLVAGDTPVSLSTSMGLGTIGFSQLFARRRPDILLALGDRFEMHAAVVAAVPFTIPIAHIHGGELTAGAIDNALRYSLTQFSHLHFVATSTAAQRLIQMGEEPWRVAVTGAPALDNLQTMNWLTETELCSRLGIGFDKPPLLVTFHPVTLEYEQTNGQIDAVLSALNAFQRPIVLTVPNADTARNAIYDALCAFVRDRTDAVMVENFGCQGYFSMMKYAGAMVGNSSSGIIEAASFGLPVVNIGTRQDGRLRAANVIDCPCQKDAIIGAIDTALSPGFRASIRGLSNPYGDGGSAERITRRLAEVPLNDHLLRKTFCAIGSAQTPNPETSVTL